MTPEERAEAIMKHVWLDWTQTHEGENDRATIKADIAAAIRDAVSAERLACAKIAEEPFLQFTKLDQVDRRPLGVQIGERIRARGLNP